MFEQSITATLQDILQGRVRFDGGVRTTAHTDGHTVTWHYSGVGGEYRIVKEYDPLEPMFPVFCLQRANGQGWDDIEVIGPDGSTRRVSDYFPHLEAEAQRRAGGR